MDLLTKSGAVISDCGKYRYRLTREWGIGPSCVFIMLNPSTADAFEDDPTIRRCIGFAKREGCGSLTVVNLMAFRSTDPSKLPPDNEALGPDNTYHVFDAATKSTGPVIAAWGSNKSALRYAGRIILGLSERGVKLSCLKKTKEGFPGHPLYIKADAPLSPFP